MRVKIDYDNLKGKVGVEVKRAACCWTKILAFARREQLVYEDLRGFFPSGIPAAHSVAGSTGNGKFAMTSIVFSHVAEGCHTFAVKAYVWFIEDQSGKSAHICISAERVDHVTEVVHQTIHLDERWAALCFTSYGDAVIITSNEVVVAGQPVDSIAVGTDRAFAMTKRFTTAFEACKVWQNFSAEQHRSGRTDFVCMRKCLEFDAARKPSKVRIEAVNYSNFLEARSRMTWRKQPAKAAVNM